MRNLFWAIILAIIVVSSYVRRDDYFWTFSLLTVLGMATVIIIGMWQKDSIKNATEKELYRLKKERELFEEEKRSVGNYINVGDGGYLEELRMLRMDKNKLENSVITLKEDKNKLENSVRTLNARCKKLEDNIKSSEKRGVKLGGLEVLRNQNIFVEEISELKKKERKYIADIMTNIDHIIAKTLVDNMDNIMAKTLADIEGRYYPAAFSEYIKNNANMDDEIKIRNIYHPNIYFEKALRRNRTWATQRSKELDDAYKNRNE